MTRTVDGYYIKNTDYQNNLVLRDPKTKKEYMCEGLQRYHRPFIRRSKRTN